MAKTHQRYIVRYKFGSSGFYGGWAEIVVYKKSNAMKYYHALKTTYGENGVEVEPFKDPVQNPYKRNKEYLKDRKRSYNTDSWSER